MKRILLFAALLFTISTTCFAQELLTRTRRLTPSVTEKYRYTIGTDREIKQGLYQAFYNKKIPIASGKYVDDKKAGLWHFFNRQGQIIENYNYDTNTLQSETAEDSTSSLHYAFDATVKETDRLTKPIRPGGRYFGYIPYLTSVKLPKDINSEDISSYAVVLEILVSPGGRLADFKVHLSSPWETDRIINVNINRLNEEDKTFVPATLNYEPISSRVAIQCVIIPQLTLEMR